VDDGFFLNLLEFIKDGSIALLEAYFDESHRKTGLLCVAGYVFASPQAKKLTREFRAAFDAYGGFHMVDLVHRRANYRGISDAERHRLVRQAVAIVKQRFSYGVAVTVDSSEYEAKAPRWIRGFGNAYPFLCHMAMAAVAKVVADHGERGPITYVYEAGHPYEAEARHAVHQMSQTQELRDHYLYSGDAFLPKKDAVPLQAADLLAWESAKFKDETVDGSRDIRLSLLSLVKDKPKHYHMSFCAGASLERAFQKYAALGLQQLMEEEWERQIKAQRNSAGSMLQ